MEVEKTLCGIFNLNGIRYQSRVKINHIENVNLGQHEYINDTLIKSFEIMKNVKGEIYLCNITHVFLTSSKKLPIMYVSITNERHMRKYLLFRVYLCFTIESDVKSVSDLITQPLDGKFSVEIAIDHTKKEMNDDISVYPGDENMYKKLTDFATADEMKTLITSLLEEIDERLRLEYEDEIKYYLPPKKIISLKKYKLD
jgi:hypothetical protein